MSNKRKVQKTPVTQSMPGESEWPKRLAWAAGILVVGGLVAIVMFSQPELRGVPDGTQTVAVNTAEHVNGNIYAAGEVPAGGAMDQIWQNCGFYGEGIRTENAMHSLEHGAVWISYDPSLSDDDIQSFRSFVGRSEKVLVSPVPGQNAPIIVSAWARQLELDDAGDSRLGQFVNEFTGGANSPERGGRCNGGVGNPQF
ncbi:MAG: hypothetical protein BMS9Abin20_0021 [Acidimicrobiia bacterium]|nr:MAG: hypothetical protein BMS9Abin20_0021 [Acidimicrobiia bacterium]